MLLNIKLSNLFEQMDTHEDTLPRTGTANESLVYHIVADSCFPPGANANFLQGLQRKGSAILFKLGSNSRRCIS